MFNMERTLTACAEDQYNDEHAEDQPTPSVRPDTTCDEVVSVPTFSPLEPAPVLPPDLPSMALVKNISQYRAVIPMLVWTQDNSDGLNLSVLVETMRDIEASQVHVMVTPTPLLVQVLENFSDTLTLYKFPSSELKLWGEVVPSLTRVVVKARMVNISMKKAEEKLWVKLSEVRHGWIREEFVEMEKSKMCEVEYNSVTDYHPFTGEKVMPEDEFEDSDEDNVSDNLEEQD